MTDGIEVEIPQLQGPLDAVELHRARQAVTPVDLLAVVIRQQDVTSFFRSRVRSWTSMNECPQSAVLVEPA